MKTESRKSRKPHAAMQATGKTCGEVLKNLAVYSERGFLTKAGAAAIEESKRRPTLARAHFQASEAQITRKRTY
jgi:hypothetical protein